MEKTLWFLTIDWCDQGKRGVFCDRKGGVFSHVMEPLGQAEADEILGPFALVLAPQWLPLTEDELAQYTTWHPLAEYGGQYRYVVKEAA